MYQVLAGACGNIDRGQDPLSEFCEVLCGKSPSLQNCVTKFKKWRDDNEVGSGNLILASILKEGTKVAVISYNGRLWDPYTEKEIKI